MNQKNRTVNVAQLCALMYSSTAADAATSRDALEEILVHAQQKNALLDVTGILLFREGRFYQYLEGPQEAVWQIYGAIKQDPRHSQLRLLLETPIVERRFSEWSMGYEQLRAAPSQTPEGFRSTFVDLEDTDQPDNVLRAVTELTYWYRARNPRG